MGTETISKFGIGTFDHLIFGFVRTNITVYINSYIYPSIAMISVCSRSVSKQSTMTRVVNIKSYIEDVR